MYRTSVLHGLRRSCALVVVFLALLLAMSISPAAAANFSESFNTDTGSLPGPYSGWTLNQGAGSVSAGRLKLNGVAIPNIQTFTRSGYTGDVTVTAKVTGPSYGNYSLGLVLGNRLFNFAPGYPGGAFRIETMQGYWGGILVNNQNIGFTPDPFNFTTMQLEWKSALNQVKVTVGSWGYNWTVDAGFVQNGTVGFMSYGYSGEGYFDDLTVSSSGGPPADTTAPTVGAVSPTSAAANQATTFSASYSDNVGVTSCTFFADGANQGSMSLSNPGGASGTASKTHAFGSMGNHTAQVQCQDAASNTGSGPSTTIAVADTTPPVLTLPGSITAEATGPSGRAVTFTVTATDNVAVAWGPTCAPSSGSTFAIGTTTVNCTAGDAAGNTGSGSFTVTVRDTTPPVLSGLPANITAEATGPSGAVVTYAAPTASDTVDGARPVTCTPASGSTFGLGTTTVNCTAADARGNTGSATFIVTVRDTTPPVLSSVPANITAEAGGPSGRVVTYAAPTASDTVDGARPVTCTPASGSTFALGTTTVTCSATDTRGNTRSATFTVTVRDTTPPSLTLPANITAEATGQSGRAVTFTATASDLVDGARSVTCAPSSGSTFALGTATVNCSASDTRSNTSTGSFTVTVRDTTPPALTLPASITAEATGAAGAAVTFTASANDIVDGARPVTCTPASGSTFALGTTTVNCSASDARSNTSTGSFTVAVRDTTPPSLTLPANITAEATGAAGAAVTFAATASDIVDGARSVTCTPASGSTFPISTTAVACSATDTRGNTGNGSFAVTVRDTTPPSVLDLLPTAASSGVATTFSAAYSDIVGVASCTLSADGVTLGSMTLSAPGGATGAASKAHTFVTPGAHTVQTTCRDQAGNTGAGQITNVAVADITGPGVSAVSPTTAFAGQAATFSAAYADNEAVASCNLIADGVDQGAMTLSAPGGASGTASRSHTFNSLGMHTAQVTCKDPEGNTGNGPVTNVTVPDTTAPTVGAASPASASVNQAAIFTASYSDNVGVSSCTLYADGVAQGAMTLSAPGGASGAASKGHAFGSVGAHTVQVRCQDAASNIGSGAVANVTVSDTAAPGVSAPTPNSASASQATVFAATYTDNLGVTSCNLLADGVDQGAMSLSAPGGASGTASKSHAFSNVGTHTAQVKCRDASGNEGAGGTTSVSVADTTAPTVGAASPAAAQVKQATTYSASYADNIGVASCNLIADGLDQGAMTLSSPGGAGGTASKSHTFASVGSHTAQAKCQDAAGNQAAGAATSVNVVDTAAPTVGAVSPTTATIGQPAIYTASYADNVAVASCNLYADGADQGAMGLGSGTASKTHTFNTVGTHTLRAQCRDGSGNIGSGPATNVNVIDTTAPIVGVASPAMALVNRATTYSASYSDNVGVASCNLYADGADVGAMTLSAPGGTSGTASGAHTFAVVDTHTVQVRCRDAAGNEGNGPAGKVSVLEALGPEVSAASPVTVPVGQSAVFSATYADPTGVASCNLVADGVGAGAMTLSAPGGTSGTASKSRTFSTVGPHTVQATCQNTFGLVGSGVLTTVNVVDNTPPVVSGMSYSSASTGWPTTLSATYSDNIGVSSCTLLIDGQDQGAMTLSAPGGGSGTASKVYTFIQAGNHTAQVKCRDGASNEGSGAVTSMSVSDGTAPTVSAVSPTTASASQAITFSATYSDNVGVASCNLFVDEVDRGAMTLSNGTASKAHTFNVLGTRRVHVKCRDAAGNQGAGLATDVAVADTSAPIIGAVSPTAAMTGLAATYSATYADNFGVASCALLADGFDLGAMTLSAPGAGSGKATKSHTFAVGGTPTLQVKCQDAAGNAGTSAPATVTVTYKDTLAPVVSGVSPTTAFAGQGPTFSATYSDNVGVTSCSLFVGGADQGPMVLSAPGGTSGTASRAHLFSSAGTGTVQAKCKDAEGNQGNGTSTSVGVQASTVQFDLSGIFNADVVINRGASGLDTTQTGVDRSNWTFMTHTAAKYMSYWLLGLPDDGSIAAGSFNPEIRLAATNENYGLNAVRLDGGGSVKFAVPVATYKEVHVSATAGQGTAGLTLRFHYADGTTEVASQTAPDWLTVITGTADRYVVSAGHRVTTSISSVDWNNYVHIYGLRFKPNASKDLAAVTIEYGGGPGVLVVFAATGVRNTAPAVADTAPPVLTPVVTGTQGNDGWYTSDVQVSWILTDAQSIITSVTGCASSTVSTDTTGLTSSCSATSYGGTASNSVTVKRDAASPSLSNVGDVAVQVAGQAATPVSYSAVSATDATSGVAGSTSCSPASGSVFLLGSTPVTCTAKDNAGNSGRVSFTVKVVDASAGVSPTITLADSEQAGPGQTVTASTAGQTSSGQSGVTASLTNGAGGTASLTVATYAGNPTSSTYFDAGGRYTDVMVQGADANAKATVKFYYPTTVPDYTYVGGWEQYYDGPYYVWRTYWSEGWDNYSWSLDYRGRRYESRDMGSDWGFFDTSYEPSYSSYYSRDYYYGYYYGWDYQSSYDAQYPWRNTVYYGPYWRSTQVAVPHKLTYFNGTAWAPVLSSGGVPPVWDKTDNLDGTVSNGRFTVVFDMTSAPKITELAGTVFGDGKDMTPPVLSGVPADMTVEATSPAGAAPTYALPTATDNLDGPVPVSCTPASGDFFPIGSTTVTCKATDTSGNTASATFTVLVRDAAPPVVGALASPAPNADGWYSGPASVSLSASDASSGVKEVSYSVNGAAPVVTQGRSASVQLTADGVYNVSYTATDNAGNTSAPATVTVKIDTTPPTVTVSRNPAANVRGWSNSNVTATFRVDDAGSGPETTPAEIVALTLASGQPVAVRSASRPGGDATSFFDVFVEVETSGLRVNVIVQDRAGNRAEGSITGIKIDKTAPTVTASASPAPNANGWNNTDVTVAASGTDDRSGIESCTTVTLANEGAGQSATVSCTDKAGNAASATVSGINIDKTAPEASSQFDPATLDVKVVGRDGGSGLASVSLVSAVPVKWGDGEEAEDEKQDKGNAELRTYRTTDLAGNTLLLVEKVKRAGHEIKARVISLQYNGGPVITVPKNKKSFEWSLNKDGSLKELEQKLEVGQGKDRQDVEAKYEGKTAETTIKVDGPKQDSKIVKPGLVLLRLATDNGKLVLEY